MTLLASRKSASMRFEALEGLEDRFALGRRLGGCRGVAHRFLRGGAHGKEKERGQQDSPGPANSRATRAGTFLSRGAR